MATGASARYGDPCGGGSTHSQRLDERGSGFMKHVFLAFGLLVLGTACTPKVAVEAPKEPITINLNIKLDADVRLRVEEKAKEDVKTNPIF